MPKAKKVTKVKVPKQLVQGKRSTERQEFFNKHALTIGSVYAEVKSWKATSAKTKLPQLMVGYVLARLLPDLIKDKYIQRMVSCDCSPEAVIAPTPPVEEQPKAESV